MIIWSRHVKFHRTWHTPGLLQICCGMKSLQHFSVGVSGVFPPSLSDCAPPYRIIFRWPSSLQCNVLLLLLGWKEAASKSSRTSLTSWKSPFMNQRLPERLPMPGIVCVEPVAGTHQEFAQFFAPDHPT